MNVVPLSCDYFFSRKSTQLGAWTMRAILLSLFAAMSLFVAFISIGEKAIAFPIQPGDILWFQSGSADGTSTQILSVDPDTGAQSILAEGGLLAEDRTLDAHFDENGDLLLAQSSRILRIDRKTGDATTVSSVGGFGITTEPNGDILLATFGDVLRVDPVSGDQTIFAPSDIPGDPLLATNAGSTTDIADVGGRLLAIQHNPFFTLIEIDRSTGLATPLSLDFSGIPQPNLFDVHLLTVENDESVILGGIVTPFSLQFVRVKVTSGLITPLFDPSLTTTPELAALGYDRPFFGWKAELGLKGELFLSGNATGNNGLLNDAALLRLLPGETVPEVMALGGLFDNVVPNPIVVVPAFAVPEPATMSLLGAGLLGAGVLALRRKRKVKALRH